MGRNIKAGYVSHKGFALNVFSDDELYAIHSATLDVLSNCGLKVYGKEAQDIYDGGGAVVDRKNNIVKIPSYMVEEAVRSAPGTLLLAGRNPKNDVVLEANRVSFSNFGEGVAVIDPYTKEHRSTMKKDVGDVARVCDALPGIGVHDRCVAAHDVIQEVAPVHQVESILTNTSKHFLLGCGNLENLRSIAEMCAVVAGGKDKLRERPIFGCITCMVSPLQLTSGGTELIIECARSGVPVNILSMALAGATAPVTLAGLLVTHNAEVLGGIVLSQLVSKGTPVIYGSTSAIMDFRYAATSVGCPELGKINAAIAKLAQYYKLPSWVAGGWSDSKVPDAQAAHEKTITAMLPALAGANIIFGMGALEAGMTMDYAQLIMDNEIALMVKKTVEGIDVTDEDLAVDVIKQVGAAGEFISNKHTFSHFKKVQSKPELLDRRMRGAWLADGAKDLTERAYEKAIDILENHKPDPLPSGAADAMREIIKEAEAKCKKD